MEECYRRRFLTSAAVVAAASAAGCNVLDDGDDDDSGGDDGSGDGGSSDDGGTTTPLPDIADWIPASMVDVTNADFQVVGLDIQGVQEEFPAQAREEFNAEELAAGFGVEVSDLEDLVVIQTGPETEHAVFTGSWDQDAVADRLSEGAETQSYEGYDVIGGEIAVGDGAVVISAQHRTIIDAGRGAVDRIYDVEGEWDPVLRNVQGGTMKAVATATEEEYELMGVELNGLENDRLELVGYAHFASANTADERADTVEGDLAEDASGEWELTEVSVEGNVVVVRGETTDWTF